MTAAVTVSGNGEAADIAVQTAMFTATVPEMIDAWDLACVRRFSLRRA